MKTALAFLLTATLFGQAAQKPPSPMPTLEEVREGMGIPSTDALRGQQDAIGFATTAEQMAKTWELSALPPHPEAFGAAVEPGVAGIICPHDDYIFAGRVYRKVIPLVTAKTIIMVGVFHRHRAFGAKDMLVFDTFRAWRAPDGEIPISPLRETLIKGLKQGEYVQSAAMHDSEHSLEAITYWLKHQRPDVEIVPILVPVASEQRMSELAGSLSASLAKAMQDKGLQLGKDVAIVISADGIHYGKNFNYEPYGQGGVKAFLEAMDKEREMLKGPLAGPISQKKVGELYEKCVDPQDPFTYRMTWCGRFSVPFGMMLIEQTARALKLPVPVGHPIALGVSVDTPELPLKSIGMGATAPANLYHFVSYPGVAYAVGATR
jgi:AmmeMemoRadiSam system protein B